MYCSWLVFPLPTLTEFSVLQFYSLWQTCLSDDIIMCWRRSQGTRGLLRRSVGWRRVHRFDTDATRRLLRNVCYSLWAIFTGVFFLVFFLWDSKGCEAWRLTAESDDCGLKDDRSISWPLMACILCCQATQIFVLLLLLWFLSLQNSRIRTQLIFRKLFVNSQKKKNFSITLISTNEKPGICASVWKWCWFKLELLSLGRGLTRNQIKAKQKQVLNH